MNPQSAGLSLHIDMVGESVMLTYHEVQEIWSGTSIPKLQDRQTTEDHSVKELKLNYAG